MERLVLHPKAKEDHRVQLFWMQWEAKREHKAWKTGMALEVETKDKEELWKPIAELGVKLEAFEATEEILQFLLKRDSEDPDVHHLLFSLYLKMQQRTRAVVHLD